MNIMITMLPASAHRAPAVRAGRVHRCLHHASWFASLLLCGLLLAACGGENEYRQRAMQVGDTIALHGLRGTVALGAYEDTWAEAIDNRGDFSTALAGKHEEYESQGFLKSEATAKQWVDSVMLTLNEPPQKVADAHRKLMEYYGNYAQIVALVKQPEGSLMSFRTRINELIAVHRRVTDELRVMGLLTPQAPVAADSAR